MRKEGSRKSTAVLPVCDLTLLSDRELFVAAAPDLPCPHPAEAIFGEGECAVLQWTDQEIVDSIAAWLLVLA